MLPVGNYKSGFTTFADKLRVHYVNRRIFSAYNILNVWLINIFEISVYCGHGKDKTKENILGLGNK